MSHQIVITRAPEGGFKISEMGLNERGLGETLRTHDLQPEISADMATKYLVRLLNELVAA